MAELDDIIKRLREIREKAIASGRPETIEDSLPPLPERLSESSKVAIVIPRRKHGSEDDR